MPHRLHPSLSRIFQQASPEDTIIFIDESYVAPGEEFSDSFYALVATAIKFKHLADTRDYLKEVAQSPYWHTTESMQTSEGQERVEAMLKLCHGFGDSHSAVCLRPLGCPRWARPRPLIFFGNIFDTPGVVPHTTHIDFCLSLRHFCHLVPAKAVLILDR